MQLATIILKAISDMESIEGHELKFESKTRLLEGLCDEITQYMLNYSERDRYLFGWHSRGGLRP